jgi:hypothetical protein
MTNGLKGGQGRSSHEMVEDVMSWILSMGVAVVIGGIILTISYAIS